MALLYLIYQQHNKYIVDKQACFFNFRFALKKNKVLC